MSISTANVDQLPMEVLVLIFKFLNLSDIFENCSNTCKIWREIIAQFFLQPYLKILTRLDSDLRDKLHDNGWTEQCFDNDFLYETYEKITSYKGILAQKYLLKDYLSLSRYIVLLKIYNS